VLSKHAMEALKALPLPCFPKITITTFCLLIISGCATSVLEHKKVITSTVHFIEQKPNYCGPASLAMIFKFWGMEANQDEIARDIYSPELKGTLSIELLLYALKRGFEAEMYSGTLQDLKEKVTAGFPLIVSHRAQKEKEKVHYLVVWGFDEGSEKVYVHSGTKKNLAMDYRTFLKRWAWADNLAFFIILEDTTRP